MNNELKEKFLKAYVKVYPNSPYMQKYCISQLSNGVELENGLLFEFMKPCIKTSFCFAVGQNGRATDEELHNASNMVNLAYSSQEYFINKNMERLNHILEDALYSNELLYVCPANNHGYVHTLITGQEVLTFPTCYKASSQLTQTDIENLKKVLEEEKMKFTKRLNTYLKRYGLSKIKAWYFISD